MSHESVNENYKETDDKFAFLQNHFAMEKKKEETKNGKKPSFIYVRICF